MKHISTKVYPVLLCLLAVAIPTSNFLMNLVWVLLGVNWLLEENMKNKWQQICENKWLQAFIGLFFIYLVGMIWSNNILQGLTLVRQMLPLLIVPLVVFTSEPLNSRQFQWLKGCYVITVIVVTGIGLVRFLTMENLPHRDIVPFISHIRFALNVSLVICILVNETLKDRRRISKFLMILLVLWMLFFLLLLQSYTGFVVLLIAALLVSIVSRRKVTALLAVSLCVMMLAVSAYYVYDYYHIKPVSGIYNGVCTVNGHSYQQTHDDFVESGGYVHHYVCLEELDTEWNKRSNMNIGDITASGYPVQSSLIRYLNALQLPKDSSGVAALSQMDIAAIENGVSNPIYNCNGSLRKMFHVMLFEFETNRCYHNVEGHSVLQRLELWKAGWKVFLEHPLFGVGTGDVYDVHQKMLREMQSPLEGKNLHIHNQYITWLASFGIFGLVLLVLLFLRPLRMEVLRNNLLLFAYGVIILVSFVGEDTLDTLAGRMFVVFIVCFINRNNVSVSHTA